MMHADLICMPHLISGEQALAAQIGGCVSATRGMRIWGVPGRLMALVWPA